MRIAPSLSVHKTEGLIDVIVHDGQIQLVVLGNTFPVFNTGAAQRIYAQLQAAFWMAAISTISASPSTNG